MDLDIFGLGIFLIWAAIFIIIVAIPAAIAGTILIPSAILYSTRIKYPRLMGIIFSISAFLYFKYFGSIPYKKYISIFLQPALMMALLAIGVIAIFSNTFPKWLIEFRDLKTGKRIAAIIIMNLAMALFSMILYNFFFNF